MDTKTLHRADFARFDLNRVPSPCFVVNEVAIERNLKILAQVAEASGARILSALKAFSMYSVAPLVRQYLSGTCASGIYEARLGREEYGGEVTTYCAGYKAADMPDILRLSDHVVLLHRLQRPARQVKPSALACGSTRNIPKVGPRNTIPPRPARASGRRFPNFHLRIGMGSTVCTCTRSANRGLSP